jgi:hypothetical protein
LTSELDIFNDKLGGSCLGSAEKVEVECKSVWLILLAESGIEMLFDDSLEREERGL